MTIREEINSHKLIRLSCFTLIIQVFIYSTVCSALFSITNVKHSLIIINTMHVNAQLNGSDTNTIRTNITPSQITVKNTDAVL